MLLFFAIVFFAVVVLAVDFLVALFFVPFLAVPVFLAVLAFFVLSVFLLARLLEPPPADFGASLRFRVSSLARSWLLPGLWPFAASTDACRAANRSTTLSDFSSLVPSGTTTSRFFFLASMSCSTRSV